MSYVLRGCVFLLATCIACQPAAAQLQHAKATSARVAQRRARATQAVPASHPPREIETISDAGSDDELLTIPRLREPFGPVDADIALGAVDPGARWVFYCEQRKSSSRAKAVVERNPLALRQRVDAMPAYLVRPPSSPRRVAALLAASPDGRFLVLLSDAQEPLLYDAQTDSTSTLADQQLDLRADGLRGSLRSIAFSPGADRIAMLTRGKTPRIIVRQLLSGAQTTVMPMGTNVWRVSFDGSGKFVVMHEVLEDTNQNGRMDWPIPERALLNTRCNATVDALDAWVPVGDTTATTIAPIEGGTAIRVDGFIAMLGSQPLTKRPGEPLVVIERGRAKRLGTTDCDMHVLAVSAEFGQVLTTCSDKNGHSLLELSSLTGSRAYDYEGTVSFVDRTDPEPERFRAVYAGAHTYLVDFRTAQVSLLQDRDQLLAQGSAGLVVRRTDRVLLIQPHSEQSATLLEDVRSGTRILLGPGHALVGRQLLSASLGKSLGQIEHPVLSLASNGCALVTLGSRGQGDLLLSGPLQWICPGS